jgi:glycosyltransferase involved in cell wall biosynthesis
MKLLVLAQIPPPVHGQSTMVRTLVEDLPADGVQLHHVNLSLSDDARDIGRWRARKATRVLQAAMRAINGRLRHRCDTLYYVPAPPGKRGALFRDWLLMALCRPWFPRLVLHWHAPGLGAWLSTRATTLERAVTRFMLSGADPAIVLSSALRADAEMFGPKRVEIVPNGVDDPGPPRGRPPVESEFRVLFLGFCHEQKGVFAAAGAVLAANRSRRREAGPLFVLEVAGPSPDEATSARLRALAREHPGEIRLHGEVGPLQRQEILDHCHVLCLPTKYEAEGMPLVVLEAFARDRPVITSDWRALRETVTPEVGRLVKSGSENAIAAALQSELETPIAPGEPRRRFLKFHTRALHARALAKALRGTEQPAAGPAK